MNQQLRKFAWAVVSLVVLAVSVGVLHAADPEQTQGETARPWGRLLALPFYDMAAIHGVDTSLRGPLSRQVFVTGEVASEADLFMNKMVERGLSKKTGLSWSVPRNFTMDSLRASTSKSAHLKAISGLGRQWGADHVLAGYLYAFRQRDGGDLGVQTPAKVVFELVVIQAATERVVWQQRFDETQQPLSENLLNLGKFIRRKGRWVRAHDMAEHAVQDMLVNMFKSRPPVIR